MSIAIDSNIFIYFIEAHPEFGVAAKNVLYSQDVIASELVYVEILADKRLVKERDRRLVEQLLEKSDVMFRNIDRRILLHAAELRRTTNLKTADAIHIASALEAGAAMFVTNDRILHKAHIAGLAIVGLDLFARGVERTEPLVEP